MKKLTKSAIIRFAIGQLGWSTLSALVANWIISFYQSDETMINEGQTIFVSQCRVILGIFTVLGGIYALGRIFAAFSAPLIGNMSDRCKSRRGRRLPFMKWSAIPFALVTVLIYCAPIDHESSLNAVWVLVTILMFYLFMTLYCTPYNALVAEMSHSQEELTNISTAISFTFILGSAIGYAAPFIWGALTPSLGRVGAIRLTFAVLSAFALICLLIPPLTLREKDYVAETKTDESNAFTSLGKTFRNHAFRVFVGSDILYWIAITMFQSGLTFFVTALMKLPETYNTILYLVMTLLSVCCYYPVNRIAHKVAKKKLVIIAFFGMSLVFLITGLSGLFGIPGLISGILVVIVAAFPMAILGILPQTIVADIAKSDALVTKENHDGMFFAARTFSMKMGQSVAALLFTSLGTIGAATGLGYRIAAFSATGLCILGAVVLTGYNEKKVMTILVEEVK